MDYRQSIPTAAALTLASLGRPGRRDLAFGVLRVAVIARGCSRVGEATQCALGGRDRDALLTQPIFTGARNRNVQSNGLHTL